MKWYNPEIMNKGLEWAQAGIEQVRLITGFTPGDSFVAVDGATIASSALSAPDVVLSDYASGRQIVTAEKMPNASGASTQHDSGTASGGGVASLIDAAKAWGADTHAGRAVKIIAGTGVGQTGRIASNAADTLTVQDNWVTEPDATSQYQIRDDLHFALVDVTNGIVVAVTDEGTDQVVSAGNLMTIPALTVRLRQPVQLQ